MICFAKPGLTEDLYVEQKEDFSITCYMCDTYTLQRRRLFIREKPILSSEMVLHRDYDSKGSVEKISGRESQKAWHQDKLIGGKPSVLR
jgi:hypothetical protein